MKKLVLTIAIALMMNITTFAQVGGGALKRSKQYERARTENNATLSVYPNPATDIMKVESTQTVGSYEVYDINGARVIRNEPNAKAFTLDLRDLPSGTYLLKTVSEGSTQTQRIVKE